MIKIFETGDIHIKENFRNYPEIREELIESRFRCLDDMVKKAEKEGCELFVITGDTFDKVSGIKVEYVKRTVNILASFGGTVLVLPGNHDYYTEEAKVWKDFKQAMDKVDHNIILLNEYKPITIEVGDETVTIYPAHCDSKHSEQNKLDWIKNEHIDTDNYNIGIAHGAIQGVTPDMEGQYYQMSEAELLDIPVDMWLIGHTHIPYPKLETGKEYKGYKIYNTGTPEQLHIENHTMGYGFIITISKESGNTEITARACHTGKIAYYDKYIGDLRPVNNALRNAIEKEISGLGENSIVKLTIKGAVKREEYERRSEIYSELLNKIMTYRIVDDDLSKEITKEKINAEFSEIGFAAAVLKELLNNPVELQMAYDLLRECRE